MAEYQLDIVHADVDAGFEALRQNEYPGRVLIQGISECGELALQGYALTGRSEGSNRRVFIEEADGSVRTIAPDKTAEEMAAMPDADLIYYRAMRSAMGLYVVSNGAQTDPVFDGLLDGKNLEQALRDAPKVVKGEKETDLSIYEPDPNHTPRITGFLDLLKGPEASFGLVVVRKSPDSEDPIYATHVEGEISNLPKGVGFGIQTYNGNSDGPLPSFDQPPFAFPSGNSAEDLAQIMWDVLPGDKRAAVVARSIDLESGEVVATQFIDNFDNQAA